MGYCVPKPPRIFAALLNPLTPDEVVAMHMAAHDLSPFPGIGRRPAPALLRPTCQQCGAPASADLKCSYCLTPLPPVAVRIPQAAADTR